MSWQEYKAEWERKLKGITFKAFCKQYDIEMVSYDGLEVEEGEIKKKEAITNNSYKMKKEYSLVFNDYVKDFEKKKKSIRLQTIYCGNGFVRVLEEKEGCYLLNIDNEYVLHCRETGESCSLGGIREYSYASVPWEKLSKFSCIAS